MKLSVLELLLSKWARSVLTRRFSISPRTGLLTHFCSLKLSFQVPLSQRGRSASTVGTFDITALCFWLSSIVWNHRLKPSFPDLMAFQRAHKGLNVTYKRLRTVSVSHVQILRTLVLWGWTPVRVLPYFFFNAYLSPEVLVRKNQMVHCANTPASVWAKRHLNSHWLRCDVTCAYPQNRVGESEHLLPCWSAKCVLERREHHQEATSPSPS